MRSLFTFLFFSVYTLISGQTTTTFITSGSFTVPAGVTSIFVECWGGGGAGGSASGTGSTTNYRAMGGGGGGGAYVAGTIMVTPGNIISYTVAPNTGANTGTTPLNGGDSSFGSVTAEGGQGGECVNAGTAGGHVGGDGGTGGIGNQNGGNGGSRIGYDGMTSGRVGAGGGGGAGSAGSGTNASNDQTSGAAGIGGSGGGGNGDDGQTNTGNGAGGDIIGGGGSGAWAAASTTLRTGGSGARGQIRITYSVLPIKIMSFEVTKLKVNSLLKLITASETNNDYFTIERSGDGMIFDAIGEIDGAGNSSEERHYKYIDANPLPGINYYRIKQTDYDGKYSYSEIRSIVHEGLQRVAISPRQTQGILQIATDMDDYAIEVYSSAGQEVARYAGLSGYQTVDIASLQSGIYFVKVVSGDHSETVKVMKY